MPLLTAPLRDLSAWTAHLRDAPIPVLDSTLLEIRALAELEEARGCVDAQMLTQAVANDPLMVMRLLAYAGQHRRPSQIADAETVTAAIMLMGIGRFFSEFSDMPTVDQRLADLPEAQEGLRRVLRRAHRAGQFALGFAVHRMDADAAVLHEAAMLHDFAEMLLWCHAPALALEVQARQQADASLRSEQVQMEVLNVHLDELEQALMQAWRLPELLRQIIDDHLNNSLIEPQRRTVTLAVRLARHSARSWDNAALPDDIEEIAGFLNLAPNATLRLLRDIDS